MACTVHSLMGTHSSKKKHELMDLGVMPAAMPMCCQLHGKIALPLLLSIQLLLVLCLESLNAAASNTSLSAALLLQLRWVPLHTGGSSRLSI
jgi:diacylglycerol kinase